MIKSTTPIYEAEAIIEPFWDPLLSGLQTWIIHPCATTGERRPEESNRGATLQDHYDYKNLYALRYSRGLRLFQSWAHAGYSWEFCPPGQIALDMERTFDLDLGDYDKLLFSLAAPGKSRVLLKCLRPRPTEE